MKDVHDLLLSKRSIKKTVEKEKGVDEAIERIGLRVPIVRKCLKENLSFVSKNRSATLKYWDNVWNNSPYFEAMSLALYFYQHRELNQVEVKKILTWIERCSCWEHSDDLSKIIAHNLEINPSWISPTLVRWNKSKNPWKRRQSVVGLLEYSSKRKIVPAFEELIVFITPLLDDEDYYVQKGVGWTLREIFNVYPQKTIRYIKEHLTSLSSIAYSTATEKLDRQKKVSFNEKRKKSRVIKSLGRGIE